MEEKTLKEKITAISEHYSKECQIKKTQEELCELFTEISAGMIINDRIVLPDNTWSEVADVIIMCAQIAMQHGKTDKVRQEIEYKVDRQIERMRTFDFVIEEENGNGNLSQNT